MRLQSKVEVKHSSQNGDGNWSVQMDWAQLPSCENNLDPASVSRGWKASFSGAQKLCFLEQDCKRKSQTERDSQMPCPLLKITSYLAAEIEGCVPLAFVRPPQPICMSVTLKKSSGTAESTWKMCSRRIELRS